MKNFSLALLSAIALAGSAFAQSGDPLPGLGKNPVVTTATTPSNGVNEIQTITIGGTPTAGTFRLTFQGQTTSAITWSATNATLIANIDAALEAMATIGTGGVTTAVGTMTAGIGTATVTFTGNQAKLAVSTMDVTSALTGSSPTIAVTETTAGVTADGRTTPAGQLLIDKGNKVLYINTGVSLNPTWTKVGLSDAQLALLSANTPTAAVADLAATTNITAVPGSFADLAAVQAYLAAAEVVPNIETRLDNLEAKINALLVQLRAGKVVTP